MYLLNCLLIICNLKLPERQTRNPCLLSWHVDHWADRWSVILIYKPYWHWVFLQFCLSLLACLKLTVLYSVLSYNFESYVQTSFFNAKDLNENIVRLVLKKLNCLKCYLNNEFGLMQNSIIWLNWFKLSKVISNWRIPQTWKGKRDLYVNRNVCKRKWAVQYINLPTQPDHWCERLGLQALLPLWEIRATCLGLLVHHNYLDYRSCGWASHQSGAWKKRKVTKEENKKKR